MNKLLKHDKIVLTALAISIIALAVALCYTVTQAIKEMDSKHVDVNKVAEEKIEYVIVNGKKFKIIEQW